MEGHDHAQDLCVNESSTLNVHISKPKELFRYGIRYAYSGDGLKRSSYVR
jgi:hypothetical protein